MSWTSSLSPKMAAILYRYAFYKGYEVGGRTNLTGAQVAAILMRFCENVAK